MKNIDDLRVESYGEKEVETKKQSIAKCAAAAGGAAVLMLGLFSLASCPVAMGGAGAWYHSCPEDECAECPECQENSCPNCPKDE